MLLFANKQQKRKICTKITYFYYYAQKKAVYAFYIRKKKRNLPILCTFNNLK